MKFFKIALSLIVVVLAVLVFVAPVGPLPGFFIGGTSAPTPDRWMDTSQTHEIKLRIPGSPPRVVIIWVVEHQEALYIVGDAKGGWVNMLGQGGPVEMRLGENRYSLKASRVTENLQPILDAYVAKYRADYPDIVDGIQSTIADGTERFGVFRLNRI